MTMSVQIRLHEFLPLNLSVKFSFASPASLRLGVYRLNIWRADGPRSGRLDSLATYRDNTQFQYDRVARHKWVRHSLATLKSAILCLQLAGRLKLAGD